VANIKALIFGHLAPIRYYEWLTKLANRKGPKELMNLSFWPQSLKRIELAHYSGNMLSGPRPGLGTVDFIYFANLQIFTKILEFFNFRKFLFFHKIFILFF